jgi:hypothetical protein
MMNAPIIRPNPEDAQLLRLFRTMGDRRALKLGLPVVAFTNITTGAKVRTRDWDLYSSSQDWLEVRADPPGRSR